MGLDGWNSDNKLKLIIDGDKIGGALLQGNGMELQMEARPIRGSLRRQTHLTLMEVVICNGTLERGEISGICASIRGGMLVEIFGRATLKFWDRIQECLVGRK
jgi:hypothetical protein